jgi:hypothetical protein
MDLLRNMKLATRLDLGIEKVFGIQITVNRKTVSGQRCAYASGGRYFQVRKAQLLRCRAGSHIAMARSPTISLQ